MARDAQREVKAVAGLRDTPSTGLQAACASVRARERTDGAGGPMTKLSGPSNRVDASGARRPGAWMRFRRDRSGVTAVEFGLIAMPFFAIVFAIAETALTFWTSEVLETAVATASRQVYTGQFQTASGNSGLTAAQLQANFKTLVCNNITALFDCPSRLSVDVRTSSTFTGASVSSPVTNGAYDPSSYGYSAPVSNQITVVRASLEYPVYVSIFGPPTGLTSGNRLVTATAVFKTEPYSQ